MQRPVKKIRSLAELPSIWSRQWGDLVAVADVRQTCTYRDLDWSSARWASALRRHGFEPGARVALWGGNSARWLARAFGVWRAGATLIPLSTFATPRELQQILDSARPDLVVTDRWLRGRDLAEILSSVQMPQSVQRVVCSHAGGASDCEPEERFLRAASPLDGGDDLAGAEDVALVLYTSGTTGRPKGVRLQHRAVLGAMWPTVARGGLRVKDRLVSSLPLFWVAGLCIRALPTLASGCALLVMETFDVGELLELLQVWQPTGIHLRPPQVTSLLSHPHFDPKLLARIRRGGGRNAWYAPHLGRARLITGYGMTEMSGYVTALSWRDSEHVRATGIGKPLPRVEIKIMDENGQECASGQTGEIVVRGPGLFQGYEGDHPRPYLDTQGFFWTGDLGFFDERGELRFVGRKKELLRCKGINVSPLEVESILAEHPSVEAAFVVGLPPDGFDQRLVALVVSRDGVNYEAAWRQWCREKLSAYKCPSDFVLVQRHEIPFGPTSKPQRRELAALAAARLAGGATTDQ
ncbi:MAG: malonyl-CoA synthase [Candidatus Binatia bacterium]|nr:MAG: malonyl-CoA synthase [Candidatus Binatia bacterium]